MEEYARLSPEDLAAYLQRISFPADSGPHQPDFPTLQALHRAHVLAIPFENLSIHIGGPGEMPIRLDLPSLMDKLVRRKRGGYCFEQNSLFGAALRAVGFEATPFEARVRLGAKSLLPRTHMVLRVEVRGESWLCDVGFGGDGLLEPVPMDGRELAHGYRTYRVVRKELEGEPAPAGSSLALAVLVLQALGMPGTEGWLDLYAVEPRPVYPIDLEVANWYTSTWPESAFVQTRTAQRITPGARFTLRGRTLSIVCGRDGAAPEVEVRELAEHEVEAVLREVMGVA